MTILASCRKKDDGDGQHERGHVFPVHQHGGGAARHADEQGPEQASGQSDAQLVGKAEAEFVRREWVWCHGASSGCYR